MSTDTVKPKSDVTQAFNLGIKLCEVIVNSKIELITTTGNFTGAEIRGLTTLLNSIKEEFKKHKR